MEQQIRQSVQRDNVSYPPEQAAGLAPFGDFDSFLWRGSEKIPLPKWWSKERDYFLRRYLKTSIVLSGIAFGRVVELQNTDWKISADTPEYERLIPHYTHKLQTVQFENGFRDFVGLWALDYLTQDNGGFVEIIGEGHVENRPYVMPDGEIQTVRAMLPLGYPSPYDTPEQADAKAKAAITGFAHMDAGQCWRTGNYEFPVVYQNARTGAISLLHRTRVWMKSQFQQATELGRGIGLCAASRSFLAIDTVESMNIYLHEKVTGNAPEIGLVSGIAMKAVEQAAQDGALQADNSGFVYWKGARLIQADSIGNALPPDIKLVGIKNIPDGFNRENEVTLNMYMIAIAFGTDIRDLGFPAQRIGQTKADAEIQDLKTGSRGRADAYRQLEIFMNTRILPAGLTFEFDNPNDAEDERAATIQRLRAETRAMRIGSGEITVREAREIAELDGDMPISLQNDNSQGESGANQSFSETTEDTQGLPSEQKQKGDNSTMIAVRLGDRDELHLPLPDSVNPAKPDTWHITMIYLPNGDMPDISSIEMSPTSLRITRSEVWNTGDGYALVLIPDNNLVLINAQLDALKIVRQNGFDYSPYADNWKPHITLGYSDTPIEPIQFEAFDLDIQEIVLEQWGTVLQSVKSLNTYHRQLIQLINQYRKGEIGKTKFKVDMRALIAKQFRLGWLAGARVVGEMDAAKLPESDVELERLIDEEFQYVQEFANAVQEATKIVTLSDITRRVGLWANQFQRLKNRAMLFFGADKRLMWREGDTAQKCQSCLGLDRQVKSAREWARLNIQPQDRQLICGGWNCECFFEVTTAPITNFELPPLGTKTHHHHDYSEDVYLALVVEAMNE